VGPQEPDEPREKKNKNRSFRTSKGGPGKKTKGEIKLRNKSIMRNGAVNGAAGRKSGGEGEIDNTKSLTRRGGGLMKRFIQPILRWGCGADTNRNSSRGDWRRGACGEKHKDPRCEE